MAMEASEFAFLFTPPSQQQPQPPPQLHPDLLRLIFARLSPPLLARVACVSRACRTAATDPALLMACWKLRDVVPAPSSSSGRSFVPRELRHFAISHPLQRWDTVDTLAVKYDVQASEIRDLNNMSSDHEVHRRRRLLIPVLEPQLLVGKTCYIESDEHARCELGVVYLHTRRIEPSSSVSARGLDDSSRAQEKGKFVSVPVQENGSGLTDDLWRAILELLPVTTLGQAACVCRLWHSIATDPAALASAFMAPWKLKEVVGRPMSKSFWRGQLGQLAISHALQRQDTIAGLAVKYGVQVPEIRRVNNMMSDHGIHSRERLLIPIADPAVLAGQTCFIEVDAFAKRELGVVYLDGSRPTRREATEKAQHRLKKEVMESLKRSLKLDDSTARYYFSLDNHGDLRGALQEFGEDLQWERDGQ